MTPIDKHINYLINLTTGLDYIHIYNFYDVNGVNPGIIKEVEIDGKTEKRLAPYSPKFNTFVMFGVESEDKPTYIVTPENGGPEESIVITQHYKVVIEFDGKDAELLALKFKALIWGYDATTYLENNNISIVSRDFKIEFMDEVVNEQMWTRRGLTFEVVVEYAFDSNLSPDIQTVNNINILDINKEENNEY